MEFSFNILKTDCCVFINSNSSTCNMGIKSSKNKKETTIDNNSEERALSSDSVDLEVGEVRISSVALDNHCNLEEEEEAKLWNKNEIRLDIMETVELNTSSEYVNASESRVSTGSDVIQHGIDDDIREIQSDSLGSIDNNDPDLSDRVSYFASSGGIDMNHPKIMDFLDTLDYKMFLKLKETMLTPREFFESEYGNIPGSLPERPQKTLESIEKPLNGPDHLLEESIDDLMTDLSDDEEGWPKYDMNDLLEEAEQKVEENPNPLFPTPDDYIKDKKTSGQYVMMSYPFKSIYSPGDRLGPIRFECLGPDGTRIQDFWTQCHEEQISLIVMFGMFNEKRGINCKRYIPDDKEEVFECQDIIVQRVTDCEYPYSHCKIQKLAVRCRLVPEEVGWYFVWHCQRDLQESPTKDYTKEDEEFEQLKCKLLRGMRTNNWLLHGPMEFSPLRDPIMERNTYLIEKEGSNVPALLEQPIQASKRRTQRESFNEMTRSYFYDNTGVVSACEQDETRIHSVEYKSNKEDSRELVPSESVSRGKRNFAAS